MFVSYLRTFERMGLKAIPMRADTGPIGGDLSHEFVILADTGESEIAYHRDFLEMSLAERSIDFEADLQPIVDAYVGQYAATDDERDRAKEAELGADLITGRGIEVGHIFYFGTKYSKPHGRAASPAPAARPARCRWAPTASACRGWWRDHRGVPRRRRHHLAGERGAVQGRADQPQRRTMPPARLPARRSTTGSQASGVDVLYDDRDERPGVKFADMDLIGLPWQLIVGPRGVQAGIVELKNRATGERRELAPEAAVSFLVA